MNTGPGVPRPPTHKSVNWRPPLPFRRTMARGLTMACPVCGSRGLFRRWFTMLERCPRCDLRFERLPGHSLGSIAINTVMSFFILAVVLTTSLILTYPEFGTLRLLAVNVSTAALVPTLLFPISKTVWAAIDLLARPLADGEVHPDFAPVDSRGNS